MYLGWSGAQCYSTCLPWAKALDLILMATKKKKVMCLGNIDDIANFNKMSNKNSPALPSPSYPQATANLLSVAITSPNYFMQMKSYNI